MAGRREDEDTSDDGDDEEKQIALSEHQAAGEQKQRRADEHAHAREACDIHRSARRTAIDHVRVDQLLFRPRALQHGDRLLSVLRFDNEVESTFEHICAEPLDRILPIDRRRRNRLALEKRARMRCLIRRAEGCDHDGVIDVHAAADLELQRCHASIRFGRAATNRSRISKPFSIDTLRDEICHAKISM